MWALWFGIVRRVPFPPTTIQAFLLITVVLEEEKKPSNLGLYFVRRRLPATPKSIDWLRVFFI